MILSLKNVSVAYGHIQAVKNISFHIQTGELVSLIGANGAGKTTIMKAIVGLQKITAGEILYLSQKPGRCHQRVRQGLVLVPEGRGIFSRMTVMENLQLGAYIFSNPEQIRHDLACVLDYFPRLRERLAQYAGTLSGGEQQMLAIARALMSRPKLLLLDEPSLGLAPILVDQIFAIIRKILQQGISILLVEQNAYQALHIADRVYVMDSGSIVFSGAAQTLLHDARIREAYLGI